MAEMTHVMVDVETTGIDPASAAILQLSAVQFNLETLETGPVFDRCPMMLPRRRWEEGTRGFWSKNKPVLDTIIARQEPARAVFEDFAKFCSTDNGLIFVSKPLKFDWPLVESHFLDLDVPFPFAHWACIDMHSYIAGLRGAVKRTEIEDEVPFPAGGAKHNALHDCVWQIDMLFHAKRNHIKVEVVG